MGIEERSNIVDHSLPKSDGWRVWKRRDPAQYRHHGMGERRKEVDGTTEMDGFSQGGLGGVVVEVVHGMCEKKIGDSRQEHIM